MLPMIIFFQLKFLYFCFNTKQFWTNFNHTIAQRFGVFLQRVICDLPNGDVPNYNLPTKLCRKKGAKSRFADSAFCPEKQQNADSEWRRPLGVRKPSLIRSFSTVGHSTSLERHSNVVWHIVIRRFFTV